MSKKPLNKGNLDLLLKLFLLVVILAAGFRFVFTSSGGLAEPSAKTDRESLAICLMERGAIMYGVDTCEYCQVQKKMFGDAFEKINYVNCDFEREKCRQELISAYPIWKIQGQQYRGIQTLDKLARLTECPATK